MKSSSFPTYLLDEAALYSHCQLIRLILCLPHDLSSHEKTQKPQKKVVASKKMMKNIFLRFQPNTLQRCPKIL
jgi:hypothetical protein